MDLKGMAAIVTGGASGLGGATAARLARGGARVTLFDLNAELGAAHADAIGGQFMKVDVTDEGAVAAAFEQAEALHGVARILVNCAGIAPAIKTVGKEHAPHPLDVFRRTVEVNLIGTFCMIARFAASLAKADEIEGERGVIVNTASVAAFDGQIGQAAYSSSKGGVVGLTLPVARDLAAVGIRVNTVAPGLIDTPIYGEGPDSEAFKAKLGESVLYPRRLGKPEELASMVVELLTNSYMNAEVVRVDGGIRMPPK